MKMKQLSFQDILEVQTLNYFIIDELLKLRDEIFKLDDIKVFPDDKSLSEFYLWKADIFSHINLIIFDYTRNEYR